jgi:YesN/AraC family two-component response regulator
MPGMSGFELLGEIQRRRECKDMLAIALSGLDDPHYVRRAYLSRAAAFIEKPCLPADFEALIHRFRAYWEHSEQGPAGAYGAYAGSSFAFLVLQFESEPNS